MQIHCVPQGSVGTLRCAHKQQEILSKNYGKRSRIAKFQRNLQDPDKKACPNPQEVLGIMLTDCKINWTKTSLNRQEILGIAFTKMSGNSWILSEVSGSSWQCPPGLQNLPGVDSKLSGLSEIAGVALPNYKMPLKIPRFAYAASACQNPHESPTIVLTKCESLYPRQLAQEMWGCTLHTLLLTATAEKYSQSYRGYWEIISREFILQSVTAPLPKNMLKVNCFGNYFGCYCNSMWGL